MISNLYPDFVNAKPISDSEDSEFHLDEKDYVSLVSNEYSSNNEQSDRICSNFSGHQAQIESETDSLETDHPIEENMETEGSIPIIVQDSANQDASMFSTFESSLGTCGHCESVYLSKLVSKYNVVFGNHFDGQSPLESLLVCLGNCNFASPAQVRGLLEAARRQDSSIGDLNLATYLTLINLEFGCHRKWLSTESFPLAASLWLISAKFDCTVILITNRIVLRQFRNDKELI